MPGDKRQFGWLPAFAGLALMAVAVAWPVQADEAVEDTVVAEDSDAQAADKDARAAANSPGAEATRLSPAVAKNKYAVLDPALELFDPRTYRVKIIIRVETPDGAVKNVIATGPIPMDWPEQRVRLISQKLSPQAKSSETILKGQAALLKLQTGPDSQRWLGLRRATVRNHPLPNQVLDPAANS